MSKKITKSFPTDPSMRYDEDGKLILTFLNDKKVDAELYSYFLSISIAEKGETRVYKKDIMPIEAIAADILLVKSR